MKIKHEHIESVLFALAAEKGQAWVANAITEEYLRQGGGELPLVPGKDWNNQQNIYHRWLKGETKTQREKIQKLIPAILAMAISKGRLIRVNQGGKFRYCIPGDNLPAEPKAASVAETDGKAFPQTAGVALPVQEAATQEDIKTETVADIVQSLPSFTETRADDLVLPSLHMANRELRRAKNHVQKWERVCAALRELNKHQDIVRQIVDSSSRIVSEK
ncbi:DUF1627 domain-containing protein [Escherichia coli]|nr:DUF1627 domain-containing protein [Escherichia coli]